MRSFKTYWLWPAVLLMLACQFTNTFMPAPATATSVRVRTRTSTPGIPAVTPPPTIASLPPPPTDVPAPVTGTANANLRIRDTPSTTGAIVGQLNDGTEVQIVGRTVASDWFQIILPANPDARGWVSAQFVTPSVPADSIPLVGSPLTPGVGPATPPPRPYP